MQLKWGEKKNFPSVQSWCQRKDQLMAHFVSDYDSLHLIAVHGNRKTKKVENKLLPIS